VLRLCSRAGRVSQSGLLVLYLLLPPSRTRLDAVWFGYLLLRKGRGTWPESWMC
jgi:hypothetical protein